ncbi:AbgT family transporter [Cuneatibacter sp. NSJ-177]|uniref:AbgT family transporter n=1 Tax=Cuneatibacter sp. NSJ-177 TaxID=2931401 RepID=UPI001FD188C9|nr:AbgT family transporter [Cuneatibacter sp. NSJ-177]MCJ7835726.1 AbgT family transporter [Cuneatibacter sp. NSJ-177]
MSRETRREKNWLDRALTRIEIAGNKIPDPMILFLGLAVAVVLLSFLLSKLGVTAVHPVTQDVVEVNNLLSVSGLVNFISGATNTFSTFTTMTVVLVAMLGVGICDSSGFFGVALHSSMAKIRGSRIKTTIIFAFICVMADFTGGTGFVVMPPLAAIIFASLGRNPLAGMLCAYASVSGGFCANLLIQSMDILNSSYTQQAIDLIGFDLTVSPAMNYYFAAAATFVLTAASAFVTLKIVEPRLPYKPEKLAERTDIGPGEKKAMKYALIAFGVFILFLCAGAIPSNGFLRDAEGAALSSSAPLMKGLTFLIGLMFFIPGAIYGRKSGTFKNSKDIINALGKAMADMGPYIALCFVISQFLGLFSASNLGIILAVNGAQWLESANFPIAVTLILFVLFCGILNLFMGSASAKWAILAPVFIPMFLLLGYHPALIQIAYRIGDACTNPISPSLAYFGILLANAKKYDKNAGMGTLMANMLPYTISFTVLMILQLLVFYFFKLPLGPGAPILLP